MKMGTCRLSGIVLLIIVLLFSCKKTEIDNNNNLSLVKLFNYPNEIYNTGILKLSDDNILLQGYDNKTDSKIIFKCDANGKLIWQKVMPPNFASQTSLLADNNGGFILIGSESVFATNPLSIAHFNSDGDSIWSNKIIIPGFTSSYTWHSSIIDEDYNIHIITSTSDSIYLIKYSMQGNLLLKKGIHLQSGAIWIDNSNYFLYDNNSGNYFIYTKVDQPDNTRVNCLIKADANGNEKWMKIDSSHLDGIGSGLILKGNRIHVFHTDGYDLDTFLYCPGNLYREQWDTA
ncbi:MAG: hypothetical protein LH629_04210, partial [Ignavibacteria bacterium]|nr:hypothetical protein [Ignavibacteria bacterium]